MALLNRNEWYDLARATCWTPSFATEAEIFPDVLAGSLGIEAERWQSYDEPYKTSYPEYVRVQREKDSGVYSVKAALERNRLFTEADEGWRSILKVHYGGVALAEYAAQQGEARMARFGMAGGMRNMATFGMLDENRHSQLQLYFPHELLSKDRQYDWAHKALHTNEWAAVALRAMNDDLFLGRDALTVSIMLTFAFESGFTNMQFVGLSADASHTGDYSFSHLISSIQTDESRHAQIGGPVLQIMLENGKKEEAQKRIDIAIARAWRIFAVVSGLAMDYYTPLEHRKHSFQEFASEFIVGQFQRALIDMGLELPWYWDILMKETGTMHHAYQLGIWHWRPTVWWNPAAGVSPEERQWLEEKYPGWNASFGRSWDVITDNLLAGRRDLTYPETLPVICNMSQLPICGIPGDDWELQDYPLTYEGRTYHFGSEIDRWIFEQEPERYRDHMSVVDRFLAGHIQPMNLEGALAYMSLGTGESGDDAHAYAWVEKIREFMARGQAA